MEDKVAILESSFLIDFLRNKSSAVELFDELERKEAVLAVASPSVMEIWEGALLSPIPEKKKKGVEELLSRLTILSLGENAAKRAAEIEALLVKQGISIGTADVMIAGITLAEGETLVTSDEHFTRIPGLRVLKYR